MESIPDLARSADLIFLGTVTDPGGSNVSVLAARETFTVVKVERALRAPGVLGDLTGKSITLDTPGGALAPPLQAIFFARSWIHGTEIAAHEIAHVDISLESQVAEAIANLPDMHLKDRLAHAKLVVLGQVTEIRPVPNQVRERSAPIWALAIVRVEQVLKGNADGAAQIYFPTSDSHHWFPCPEFTAGQRGVFLLHSIDPKAGRWLPPAVYGPDAMTSLDPADSQPESKLDDIKALLAGQ